MSPVIAVAAAEADQFDRIIALLEQAKLPTRDLTRASIDGFLVATEAGQVVAAVALERFGDVGLLRSLVVARPYQRKGLGRAMVEALEQRARDLGIAHLGLLTETAGRFFDALGYRVGERADAPAAVQTSAEFAFICPASAVYMEKRLR